MIWGSGLRFVTSTVILSLCDDSAAAKRGFGPFVVTGCRFLLILFIDLIMPVRFRFYDQADFRCFVRRYGRAGGCGG